MALQQIRMTIGQLAEHASQILALTTTSPIVKEALQRIGENGHYAADWLRQPGERRLYKQAYR